MSGISKENMAFLKSVKKVYFVAMKEELDAECTTSEVVYTGVGKARATRALLQWLRGRKAGDEMPLIISIGTAGSGRHHRSAILLVEDFINNGDSFIREQIHFDVLPDPTNYICASSDFFISEQNFEKKHVLRMKDAFNCMDMESFALANICNTFDIPFMAIKCISDGADETVESFDEMLPKFKAILNKIVADLD